MKAFFKGMLTLALVLGPTFYFGITSEETGRMGIAAAAGAAAAMLLNLDRLAEISLLGFSAKLRGVISEAYAKMDALQSLATEVIAANVRLMTRGGRWGGGFGLEDRAEAVDRFCKVADQLDISDQTEIQAALEEHHDYTAFDYFGRFQKELKGYPAEVANELAPLCKVSPVPQFPTEKEILDVFDRNLCKIQPEDRERLADFLYYREHNRPRRQT